MELFTALVYYFECCDQGTLDVFYAECAMTDVVGIVERVKDDEWVLEWAASRIFAEYHVVTVQVIHMRLELATVEVEEAREVATDGSLFVSVVGLEVSAHHQHQTVRTYASIIWHRQKGLVEYLLHDHHYWSKVFALLHQVLYVIDGVDATMIARHRASVHLIVIFEILLTLLIDTYVYFQISHRWLDLFGFKSKLREVDVLGLCFCLLILAIFILLFAFFVYPLNCFFNLAFVDHLKVDNQLDDRHICSMDELDFVYLTFVFQEAEVVVEFLHHPQQLVLAGVLTSIVVI